MYLYYNTLFVCCQLFLSNYLIFFMSAKLVKLLTT
nr:MAG TPA: hypothetical protein [Caudoviricetes sp.]